MSKTNTQLLTASRMAVDTMNLFAPEGKSDGWWYSNLPKLERYLEKEIKVLKEQALEERANLCL